MAKKQKLTTDDFDLDAELDFGDFDTDIIDGKTNKDIGKNTRTPITRAFTGAVSGAKSKFMDTNFLSALLRESLPQEYGESIDRTGDITSNVKTLYNDAVKDVKPAVRNLATQVDKLIPANMVRTKANLKKFTDRLTPNGYRPPTMDELQEQGIQTMLADVFKGQEEQRAGERAEDESVSQINEAIETKRFTTSFQTLNSISMGVNRLADYNSTINAAFQKKSLELQFRSYFVQNENLKMSKEFFTVFKNQNEAIVKNTALPEYVKIHQSERFKELARTKFFESMHQGLFGGNDFVKKAMTKVSSRVKEGVSKFKDKVQTAAGLADEAHEGRQQARDLREQAESMGEANPLDPATMGGGFAGGGLASLFGKWIGRRIQKATEDPNSRIAQTGANILRYALNPAAAAEAAAKSRLLQHDDVQYNDNWLTSTKKNILNTGREALRGGLNDSLREGPDTSLDNTAANGVRNATGQALFNNQSQKSLVTIIPGYLARIFRELQVTRTGNANVGLTSFDLDKGTFGDKSQVLKSIKDRLQTSVDSKGYKGKMDETLEKFGMGKKMSAKSKAALTDRLQEMTMKNGDITYDKLLDPAFLATLDPRTAKALELRVKKHQATQDGSNQQKDVALTRSVMGLKNAVGDMRGDIQKYVEAGYKDLLVEMGFVNEKDGKLNVDMGAYKNLMSGKEIANARQPVEDLALPGTQPPSTGETETVKKLTAIEKWLKAAFTKANGFLKTIESNTRGGLVTSDEDTKTGITPVSPKPTKQFGPTKILNAIKHIDVSKWRYKEGEGDRSKGSDGKEYMGPMAQDVHKQFGDIAAPKGKKLSLITMNGINLSAIKELQQEQEVIKSRLPQDQPHPDDVVRPTVIPPGSKDDMLSLIKAIKGDTGKLVDGVGGLTSSFDLNFKAMLESSQQQLGALTKAMTGRFDMLRSQWGKVDWEALQGDARTLRQQNTDAAKSFVGNQWNKGKDRAQQAYQVFNNRVATPAKEFLDKKGFGSKEAIAEQAKKLYAQGSDLLGSAVERIKQATKTFMSKHLPAGFATLQSLKDKGKAKLNDLVDPIVDVYKKGSTTPLLSAVMMRMGKYYDQVSGKLITRPGDITGPVVNEEGEVVLTEEDLKESLVDRFGKPIVALRDQIKRLGAAIIGKGIQGIKSTMSALRSAPGLDSIKDMAGGLTQRLSMTLSSIGSGNTTTNNLLTEIRDLLVERLGKDDDVPAFNDRDNSGDRDGSWRDQLRDMKNKPTPQPAETASNEPRYRSSGNVIDKMISAGRKLLPSNDPANPTPSVRDRASNLVTQGKGLATKGMERLKEVFRRTPTPAPGTPPAPPTPPAPRLSLRQRAGSALSGLGQGVRGMTSKGLGLLGGLVSTPAAPTTAADTSDTAELKAKLAKQDKKLTAMQNAQEDDKPKAKVDSNTKPAFNDRDGDGRRDGDWRDQLDKEKKAEKERQDAQKVELDHTPRYKSDKNVIDQMIEKAKGAFGSIKEGLGDLADVVGEGKSAGKAGRAGRAARTARGAGKMSKLMSMGKTAVGALGALGGLVPTGALAAGASTVATAGMSAGAAALSGLGVAAGAVGTFLASPVVLGAGAVALAGYAGYKGYQRLTRNNASKLDEVRMRQYGLTAADDSYYHFVFELESYLEESAVGFTDGQAQIQKGKLDVSKVLDTFSIDEKDKDRVEQFMDWFGNRFKPIFLTHLTALSKIDNKMKLREADDLKDTDKSTYLNAIAFEGGPYNRSTSPFTDLRVLSAGAEEVKAAIEAVRKTIKTKSGEKKAVSLLPTKSPNATALGVAAKAGIVPVDTPSALAASLVKTTAPTAAAKLLLRSTVQVAALSTNSVSALEGVRFRTYGLTELETGKVSTLRHLEAVAGDSVRFGGNREASFDGNVVTVFDAVGTEFGIASLTSEEGTAWLHWFSKRFLPVFLAYMGNGKMLTEKKSAVDIETALSDSQRYDVAVKLSGVQDVWGETESPWKAFVLNTQVTSIDENLAFLKEKAKKATLQEQKTSGKQLDTDQPNQRTMSEKRLDSFTQKLDEGEKKQNVTVKANNGEEKESETTSGSGNKIPLAKGPLASGEGSDAFLRKNDSKVDVDGLQPNVLQNLKGMAEEYGTTTGKSLTITSGFRSKEKQEALYRQNPKLAAPPGRSLHEFGLALDADPKALDDAEKNGLMRKYGFTRPVGGEPWHVEPAGIQLDINGAKSDPTVAAQAVDASLGKGGGGLGTEVGSKTGKRDNKLAKSLFGDASSAPLDRTSRVNDSENRMPEKPVIASKEKTPAQLGGQSEGETKPTTPSPATASPPAPKDKSEVKQVIAKAAKETKTDAGTLGTVAAMESGLNPTAKAKGSSAEGLMQFVKGTWHAMLKKYGNKYNLEPDASPSDAYASALMGGEYLKENAKSIASVKPNPSPTDLYMAHFLGGGGARTFFKADPNASAPDVLPDAAKSNPTIFYADGKPKTIAGVYAGMQQKYNKAATTFGTGVAVEPSALPTDKKDTGVAPVSSAEPKVKPSGLSQPSQMAGVETTPSNVAQPPAVVAAPSKPPSLFGLPPQQPRAKEENSGFDSMNGVGQLARTMGDTLIKSLGVQEKMLLALNSLVTTLSPEKLASSLKTAMGDTTAASTTEAAVPPKAPASQVRASAPMASSAVSLRRGSV